MKRSSFRMVCIAVSLGAGLLACEGGSPFAACGLAPIPAGFPSDERIPNAAQGRLTESGVAVLEAELPRLLTDGSGVLRVEIPRVSGSTEICPRGDCFGTIELEPDGVERPVELELVEGTNEVRLTLRVAFRSTDEAGAPADIPVSSFGVTCQVNVDSAAGVRPHVALTARYALAAESSARPLRAGYTTIVQITPFAFAAGEGLETDDVVLRSGGFGCTLAADTIRTYAAQLVRDALTTAARQAIDRLLCVRPGDTGCPSGSTATAAGVCVYDSHPNICVSALIGADGQGNPTGQLLSGFSPGARGFVQTLLAAGGDGVNVSSGTSLFFFGGMRSTDAAFSVDRARDPCVPEQPLPTVPIIPRASAFETNVIPGTDTPMHVAFALSESYLNYASYFLYDSGALCVGAGAPASPQLHTGIATLLIDSLEELAYPRPEAPIAIAMRPQLPPEIELGDGATEPVVTVRLNRVMFDLYVYSLERYVRVLTFRTNVALPLDVDVADGALEVRSRGVALSTSEVVESALLPNRPSTLASALEAALPLLMDPLLADVPPVELPGLLGLELRALDGGVRTFAQGGDQFVAVYGELGAPRPSALVASADTALRVDAVDVDPRALALESWDDAPAPSVRISIEAFGGPADARYEVSHRIDGMAWSAWSEATDVTLSHPALRLSARHLVEARARLVGEPASMDPEPARVTVIVDARAPSVWLEPVDGGYRIVADDVVSPHAIDARYTLDGATWTEWAPIGSLGVLPVAPAEVEARDEAGNVGSSEWGLIRGLPDPSAEGCGCRAAGARHTGGGGLILIALAAGLFALRRRRAALAPLLGALALVACGDPASCDPECPAPIPGAVAGSRCCAGMCVDYDLVALCADGQVCASHDDVVLDACVPRCTQCIVPPPLAAGMLATHLASAVTPDGQILIAGYDPGRFDGPPFGDLVVGLWGGGERIAWEVVDGVPAERPAFDPATWRGGVGAPGDDVGQWASAASGRERVYVAYYDATHGALKVARRDADGSWHVHVLDDRADAGLHTALAVSSSGAPAVAFRRLAPDPAQAGRFVSSVEVALASSATPSSASDWAVTEVAAVPTPCRPAWCAGGDVCLASGACVTPTSDCGSCGPGTACVAGACERALAAPYVEPLPPGVGLYNGLSFTPDGELALVSYDRSSGTLLGARTMAGAWQSAFAVDGYGAGEDADAGMGASLVVDRQGDWHLSYVDASAEQLMYARVRGHDVVRSVVDDGSTDGSARNPDGRHIVGDDSSIAVIPTGEVRIVYQDATAMQTRMATRASIADPWVIRIVDDQDFTGFFTQQIVGAGRTFVVSAYRGPAGSGRYGVRVLVPDLDPEPAP